MATRRIRSPARGVKDGLKKDFERAKQAALTGDDYRGHGAAWSHGYLNQKPWHPASFRNQRLLYLEEAKAEHEEIKRKEAQEEFNKEQEFFMTSALLSEHDRQKVNNTQALSFMYQKPPGYDAMIEREKEDALKAEKEKARAEAEDGEEKEPHKLKRDMYGHAVPTAAEFDVLKNAPKEDFLGDAAVHAKPFGVELKLVKCQRCGKFGHRGTDRECPLRDQNPNDAFRQRLEDPMSIMQARSEIMKEERLQLKRAPGEGVLGGFKADSANQQILPDEEDHGPAQSDRIFGSKKEKKRLVKEYLREEKRRKKEAKQSKREAALQYLREAGMEPPPEAGAAKDKERKHGKKSRAHKHKHKKAKKKRKHESSSSSSSSSSGSDTSGSDREEGDRKSKRAKH